MKKGVLGGSLQCRLIALLFHKRAYYKKGARCNIVEVPNPQASEAENLSKCNDTMHSYGG